MGTPPLSTVLVTAYHFYPQGFRLYTDLFVSWFHVMSFSRRQCRLSRVFLLGVVDHSTVVCASLSIFPVLDLWGLVRKCFAARWLNHAQVWSLLSWEKTERLISAVRRQNLHQLLSCGLRSSMLDMRRTWAPLVVVFICPDRVLVALRDLTIVAVLIVEWSIFVHLFCKLASSSYSRTKEDEYERHGCQYCTDPA